MVVGNGHTLYTIKGRWIDSCWDEFFFLIRVAETENKHPGRMCNIKMTIIIYRLSWTVKILNDMNETT